MTMEQCPKCLHWMREYQHTHRCPNCGHTKPKIGYNDFHGRASLYPNHTSTATVLAPGFIKLMIYIAVMVAFLMALGLSMDAITPSMQGGGI